MFHIHRPRRALPPSWRTWALLACLAVFLISGALLVHDLWRGSREQDAYARLARQVREGAAQSAQSPAQSSAAGAGEAEDSGTAETGGRLEQYQLLHQQNQDMAGWLYLEGTQLDYPVMYTPEDPEHYLRRAFDGSYAVSGSLFIGAGCTPDASHVIIYGHNMNNGSMFGSLSQYAQERYGRAHPQIHYDTLTQEGVYQVMAVFYSRVYTDQDEDVFRYYQYTDLSDPAVFQEYVSLAKAASLYDTGVETQYGDRLLTLSTCSYHTADGRFVVVARQAGGAGPDG